MTVWHVVSLPRYGVSTHIIESFGYFHNRDNAVLALKKASNLVPQEEIVIIQAIYTED